MNSTPDMLAELPEANDILPFSGKPDTRLNPVQMAIALATEHLVGKQPKKWKAAMDIVDRMSEDMRRWIIVYLRGKKAEREHLSEEDRKIIARFRKRWQRKTIGSVDEGICRKLLASKPQSPNLDPSEALLLKLLESKTPTP